MFINGLFCQQNYAIVSPLETRQQNTLSENQNTVPPPSQESIQILKIA
jgi:hypothetical protein